MTLNLNGEWIINEILTWKQEEVLLLILISARFNFTHDTLGSEYKEDFPYIFHSARICRARASAITKYTQQCTYEELLEALKKRIDELE